MEPQEREELVDAFDIILGSEYLTDEFDDYGSLYEYLREIRDSAANKTLNVDLYDPEEYE